MQTCKTNMVTIRSLIFVHLMQHAGVQFGVGGNFSVSYVADVEQSLNAQHLVLWVF